jgi:hypothetical protein
MKKAVGILAVVLMGSLLGASDGRAGSAGAPAGKTSGPSMTATIVMDLTGDTRPPNSPNPPKGLTSIRIQKSSASASAFFNSDVVFGPDCFDASVVGDTDGRFVGKLNGWVPASVLNSLFGAAGSKAAITGTDYAVCTIVDFGSAGARHYLSFTAVIQFSQQ